MGKVSLRDVAVRRNNQTLIEIPSLDLNERRIGILGANGSGKSTLLRLIDGLVSPDSGKVTVDGLDTVRSGRVVRRKVGFCFQDPTDQIILPVVNEDVEFGLANRGVPRDQRIQSVRTILDRLGIADLADRTPSSLSGGERQLVALAAVLVTEPEIVLFDEPTGSLDLIRSLRFTRILASLDVQAVVATHDLDLVTGFERVLVLHHGLVVFDGHSVDAVKAYRALSLGEAGGPG